MGTSSGDLVAGLFLDPSPPPTAPAPLAPSSCFLFDLSLLFQTIGSLVRVKAAGGEGNGERKRMLVWFVQSRGEEKKSGKRKPNKGKEGKRKSKRKRKRNRKRKRVGKRKIRKRKKQIQREKERKREREKERKREREKERKRERQKERQKEKRNRKRKGKRGS